MPPPTSTATLPAPTQDWLLLISRREGYPAIYAVRPDGSGLTKLMDELSFIYEAALSPDGARIAFTANSPTDGEWDIFIMNVDGTNLLNLTTGRFDERTGSPMNDANPAWSPDGKRLAFNSNGDIFVIASDGNGLVQLTNDPSWEGLPSWSPNGSQIAFNSERGGNPDIYLINADGSGLKRLTDNPGADGSPLWSPDGSKIVFISDRDGNEEIYLMDPDGSRQTNLTQNPELDATTLWSPDGAHLLFTSYRDGRSRKYLMNADGSDPVPLPDQLADGRMMAWGYSPALSDFARIPATPTATPAPTQALSIEEEEELALQTLLTFFDLLHTGEYEQASDLYGGSYEMLMESNPTLHPKDHTTLLKHACEINGLQCLQVHDAVIQEQKTPHEFQFIVEFEYDDGSLFVSGACCGATETDMPPVQQFPYTVKRFNDQFRVMELPVYVP
jgi:Tol biopolymer transport system component